MILGLLSASVYCVVVLVALRTWRRRAPVTIHLVCALLVHILTTLSLLDTQREWSYWQMASVYWFSFMLYLYCYSAFYKSLSLRILTFIAESESQSRTTPEILDRIILRSFSDRTDILADGGLVTRSGHSYSVTEKGKRMAMLLRRLRRYLNITEGGFYFN